MEKILKFEILHNALYFFFQNYNLLAIADRMYFDAPMILAALILIYLN